jgi:hypothetical protein
MMAQQHYSSDTGKVSRYARVPWYLHSGAQSMTRVQYGARGFGKEQLWDAYLEYTQ